MIGYLKGKMLAATEDYLLLDVGGVGYKLFTLAHMRAQAPGTELEFWTHLAVREQALDLFAFETRAELDFFELLTQVSGIGPKSALAILSLSSISHLQTAILQEDTSSLTQVSGIGPKSARKIVAELKDKLEKKGFSTSDAGTADLKADNEVIEALLALGYSTQSARAATQKTDHTLPTSERIRAALKNIN